METKVVKLEIGKLLAFVIAVVVVASVAGIALQNTYFKGALTINTNDEELTMDYFNHVAAMGVNIEKGMNGKEAVAVLKEALYRDPIGSKLADETTVAFSTMDSEMILGFLKEYLPEYQARQEKVSLLDKESVLSAYQDLVADFAIKTLSEYQSNYVLSEYQDLTANIDTLANATTIDAVIVTDVKESFIDLGISEIDTIKFDAPLIETVNTYDSVSFDSALEILNNDIEAGIEPAIYFDKFDSALDTIKQDVAIDATSIDLMKSIEAIDKDIDVQLNGWIDTIDTLTIDSVAIDNDVLAKAIDSGKGFDVLAKSFNGFVINVEKGMDVDSAVATLAKDINGIMPGLILN